MAAGGYTAHLDNLKQIGAEFLPEAIQHLDDAIDNLDDAHDERKGAFFGSADIFTDLHRNWSSVYNSISYPIRQSRESLDLARQAIIEAEKRYRALEGEG